MIDTAIHTLVATIPVGGMGVAITPDGKYSYVTNYNLKIITVIDTVTNTVAATIPAGATPWDVVIISDGRRAYVTNAPPPGGDNSINAITVIDLATNTSIRLVRYPENLW